MDKLTLSLTAALDSSDAVNAVAETLATLTLEQKIRVVRSLQGVGLQRKLWKAVSEAPRLSISDLVPEAVESMEPIILHGKNSLPVFSHFRKICCRPPSDTAVLWGYNDSPLSPLIGPGYYVVHPSEASPLGGVAFDYTMIPQGRIAAWPQLRPNRRGASRLVYAGMIDYMRRVADDVFIGSATRSGRELGNYFVVVRELPA